LRAPSRLGVARRAVEYELRWVRPHQHTPNPRALKTSARAARAFAEWVPRDVTPARAKAVPEGNAELEKRMIAAVALYIRYSVKAKK